MKQFHCKYCERPMKVTALAYKSNQYCNACFEERVNKNLFGAKTSYKFMFMGESFDIATKKKSGKKNPKP